MHLSKLLFDTDKESILRAKGQIAKKPQLVSEAIIEVGRQ